MRGRIKMTLLLHELRMNRKSFLIWFLSVALFCGGCILLFPAFKNTMKGMMDSYAQMGSLTTAFGMDRVSIATMEGFFAIEIGIMYSLGAAMFAALLSVGILSKEENGHTSEFLHTLPLGRINIVAVKFAAVVLSILVFNLLCFGIYLLCFQMVGEDVNVKSIAAYMFSQFLLDLEIGCICFAISAASRRVQMGVGLGITLLFYVIDLICRVVPDIKNLKYITPFYYANASDIIGSKGDLNGRLILIGMGVALVSVVFAFVRYNQRDLAA